MDKCRGYEEDYTKFSLYIRGFWLPSLQLQMDKGLLKTTVVKFRSQINLLRKGTTTFEIDGEKVIYQGLLDAQGRAHGHGVAAVCRNMDYSWTGTFKDSMPHGIGKWHSF